MGEPINKLEVEYNANTGRLQAIQNQISALMQELESIKKKNEHLTYCLNLLGKEVQPTPQPESSKKSIRSELFDLMQIGETITIDEAWNRAISHGINTTKPTINTSLHNLVIDGLLEKPAKGLYKKPA